jgi:uncharacterized protein YggE
VRLEGWIWAPSVRSTNQGDFDLEVSKNGGENLRATPNGEIRARAREVAMNNAIEKAEQLTALADAELGEVLTINETAGTPVPRRVVAEEAEAAGAVPIAPGLQTIEVTLQVSWRIR